MLSVFEQINPSQLTALKASQGRKWQLHRLVKGVVCCTWTLAVVAGVWAITMVLLSKRAYE